MGKLDDAKRAAAEAAQRRAAAVETSPTEQKMRHVSNGVREESALETYKRETIDAADRAWVKQDANSRYPVEPKKVKAEGGGRKPRANPMELALTVRLGGGERAELVKAADQTGLPLSVWARDVLLREARK